MLITYNDDQQGYPHPDHLRVHDISVLAFERAGDPAWYPELGRAVAAGEALLHGLEPHRLLAVHEALLRIKGESPFDEKWFERPRHRRSDHDPLDVGDYLWARSGSLRAHATQVDPNEAFWFGLTDEELAEAYPYEDWILARSHVGEPAAGTVEDDLFAGVTGPVSGRDGTVDEHRPVPRSRCRRRTRSSPAPTTPSWWSPSPSPMSGSTRPWPTCRASSRRRAPRTCCSTS